MNVEQQISNARQAWLADKHDESLSLFRSAHAARPQDLRLAIELANYLGMRFEITESEQILQRCEAAAGDNPRVWNQIGLAYQRSYRAHDALRCFQEATKDQPHVQPLLSIVEWFERRGMLSDARDALERTPVDIPEVQRWRAKLARREGNLNAAEQTLREIVEASESPSIDRAEEATRIAAWYELAEIFDEQDRIGEAIEAAKKAKGLQSPKVQEQLQIAKVLAPLEMNFVSSVTADHFKRWQDECDHQPTALLTGNPRSGTSMMCRMLGMHNQLAVADEIEAYPTYLQPRMLAGKSGTSAAAVLDSISDQQLTECRSLYRIWLAQAIDCDLTNQPILDKFPSTTFLIAPFRRLFPNATIVVAIRDPRDVVVSCFLRHLEINPVSAMFSRLDLAVARCHAEMSAWLRLRGKLTPPWFEIRYEDVVAGDYQSMAKVHESLGLQWDDGYADIRGSLTQRPIRSPTYAQLRKPITTKRLGRWKLYQEFLEPQLATLTKLAKQLGYE